MVEETVLKMQLYVVLFVGYCIEQVAVLEAVNNDLKVFTEDMERDFEHHIAKVREGKE